MINDRYAIYFVLNGLHNGEDGVYAVTCAGDQQEDGWYFLTEGEDDGHGPFNSRDEAVKAAEMAAPKIVKLPSEWALEGVYVVEGWTPKPGAPLDYYDTDGNKRDGLVMAYDGESITIQGRRITFTTETFKVRFGR